MPAPVRGASALPAASLLFLFLLAAAGLSSVDAAPRRTLDEVVARVDRHPDVRAAAESRAAAAAESRQAAAWPNPSLAWERESLGDPAPSSEWRLSFEQPMEWPHVRSARRAGARSLEEAAESRREAALRDALLDIETAFADLARLESRLSLADTTSALLDRIVAAATERHAAGDLADLDLVRLEAEGARQDVERGRLDVEIDHVREALASFVDWPSDSLAGGVDAAALTEAPWTGTILASSWRRPAEATALIEEAEAAEARARLLGAETWPKPTIGIGYRSVSGEGPADSDGPIVSLGAEVPLWNRNGGAQEAARATARQRRAEADAVERKSVVTYTAALRAAEAADERLRRIEPLLRDRGPRLLKAADSAFREGDFSWIEWKDALSAWTELQTLRFDLLHDRFVNWNQARRFAGLSLEEAR